MHIIIRIDLHNIILIAWHGNQVPHLIGIILKTFDCDRALIKNGNDRLQFAKTQLSIDINFLVQIESFIWPTFLIHGYQQKL